MVLDAQAWLPVVAVRQGSNVEDLLSQAGNRPALVLDPFVPGQQGGTGQQLDWDLARNFVERFSGRVILAGGLSPENVAEAVRFVRPWAVDASSRLETSPGKKDLNLVESFIREAKKKS
jgi:phosphoribosylanthranilate isomerase